jgi:hypothetical protein
VLVGSLWQAVTILGAGAVVRVLLSTFVTMAGTELDLSERFFMGLAAVSKATTQVT